MISSSDSPNQPRIRSKSFPKTARLSILVSIPVKLDTLHFERPPNSQGKFTFVWTLITEAWLVE